MRTLLLALAATLVAVIPLAARAQSEPSYATSPESQDSGGDAQIRGRVVAFDGGYALDVDDEKGYTDRIRLHQGTIINPTGLTLAPGMVVSVLGYNAGSFFAANEIDTPYASYDGGWYYRDHPYDYYGPSVGLGFYFGNAGWWHGPAFYGPYHFYRGYRDYGHIGFEGYAGGYGRGYGHPGYGGGYGHPGAGDGYGRPGYGGGYGHPGGGYDRPGFPSDGRARRESHGPPIRGGYGGGHPGGAHAVGGGHPGGQPHGGGGPGHF